MPRLLLDLRHAWRACRVRPGVTAAIILVLALGIGLTTAMFALSDPYVLQPLPYANADRLVVIRLVQRRELSPDFSSSSHDTLPTLADWKARSDLFDAVAAYRIRKPIRVKLADTTVALRTIEATENFFDVLQAPVRISNGWRASANASELPLALSAGTFARIFMGDVAAVGRAIDVQGGGTIRIVETLPAGFVFPRDDGRVHIDALTPTRADRLIDQQRSGSSTAYSAFTVIARLRPGLRPSAARDALVRGLPAHTATQIELVSVESYMTRRVRPLAVGALSAGLLIMFVCAGNVANLLLAHGVYRARQFAIRECLGATRLDLARLMLAELGLLSAGGMAGGIVLAELMLVAAAQVLPEEYTMLGAPSITARVVVFASVMSGVVMVAGVISAWTAWRLRAGLLIGNIVFTETRRVRLLRIAMATTQTALAMVLLVGATLLVRSYLALMFRDDGFSGEVTVASVSYPATHAGVPLQNNIDETLDRLRRVPGVQVVAAAVGPMLDHSNMMSVVAVNGRMIPVAYKSVTPSYFAAVGSTLLGGRSLTPRDTNGTAVVVNESLAHQVGSDGAALGGLVGGATPAEIVGIVHDTVDLSLDAAPTPTIFALLENPWADCVGSCNNVVHYILRLQENVSTSIIEAAQHEVARVDRDAVIVDTSSIRTRLIGSVKDKSFATLVLTLFAATSIGVCIAGLVGIVAFGIARRTKEIAIRITIGASRKRVIWMVTREAVRSATTGVVAGALVGRWLSAVLEHFLYGVRPGDWLTVCAAGLGMLLVSVMAAAITAARALRLSPIDALRVE